MKLIISSFILFFVLLAASVKFVSTPKMVRSRLGPPVQASPTPTAVAAYPVRDFVLNPEQVRAVLPDEIREPVLAQLKALPLAESKLSQEASLLFISAQSRTGDGKRVANRIFFFRRPRFDIWLMKQSEAERQAVPSSWNRIAIAVDREVRPLKSYYLELGHVDGKQAPQLMAFSAACLACHSGGPRLIRPEASEWTNPFSNAQLARLKSWNQVISGYREVVDHRPVWQGRPMAEYGLPDEREELQIHDCRECHASHSGIRGPLRRENADSIWFLSHRATDANGFILPPNKAEKASMPLERAALPEANLKCLRDWLDQDAPRLHHDGCEANGERAVPLKADWMLDPFFSRLEARAQTSFSSIRVSNFLLSGRGGCLADLCRGRVEMELGDLRTGNQTRDEHLAHLLRSSQLATSGIRARPDSDVAPALVAELEVQNLDLTEVRTQAVCHLRFLGQRREVKIKTRCQRDGDRLRCDVETEIHLQDYGIAPPRFLGLEVKDLVHVVGHMEWRLNPVATSAPCHFS